MVRRPFVAILIALLVLTAGCSGLFPGGDETTREPTREPYAVPETRQPPTSTTATTVTPRASANFREAVRNHSDALRSAGQFVMRERLYRKTQYLGQGGDVFTSRVNQSFAADLAADRYWFGLASTPADGVYDSGAAYQNETGVYQRVTDTDGTVRYRRVPGREPTPREWAQDRLNYLPNVTVLLPFERDGSVTVDGEEMARYTASEPPYFDSCPLWPSIDFRNVTAFRATAVVDDRGVVRRFECVVSGYVSADTRVTIRVDWTVTEVGTATVRPPDRSANATGSLRSRIPTTEATEESERPATASSVARRGRPARTGINRE